MPLFPSLFKRFIDLLLPLCCIKCGTILKNTEGLCAICWSSLSFITTPYCTCCGLPFSFDIEEGALCGACSYTPPAYKTARSVFIYTEESKKLLLKFKHTDSLYLAPLFAQWMARAFKDVTNPLYIPVPLHWTRLFMRTYNQAALLASTLAKLKGGVYAPFLLKRQRRTPSQGHFSPKGRLENVKGAFVVPKAKRKFLADKTIVLVDDVFTTGATLNACSQALLKAGARDVQAVTLGRVIKS